MLLTQPLQPLQDVLTPLSDAVDTPVLTPLSDAVDTAITAVTGRSASHLLISPRPPPPSRCVLILGRRPAAVGVAPVLAAQRTELLEDRHHGQLLAAEVLGEAVPEHQVLECRLLHRAALRRLEVVHQGEDALTLGGVGRDG